ncbi:sodium/proton antiporter (CPA1 family) [Pseudonocardia sediminis]|uniref:Sodium/proton antiporter (CPA1 family) n=1 Tax=Pseudonocardia sediminis TaxID=1397368 RepID=A0A4Q7UXX3_PSEST|nr:cation:proton antiporter [Pseudonocardia sediminis]RZT86892.1 sodium/proton antiporter (CPA1 family) [Pseudonocardia sediminis]
MDLFDLTYGLIGVGALLAGLLPRLLAGRPLSLPIVFLGLGMAAFAAVPGLPDPDPIAHPDLAVHLTEIGVIVALMGAGLKLDRPVGRKAWASTWRLLAVAMPLTIAAMAFLGWWWAGLVPAAALLLGSALSPTDPVLASDVQVGEPSGDPDEEEDEVRFALTSEAGLNDALAFPFVMAAIAMATLGAAPSGWVGGWLFDDVLLKIVVGAAAGLLVGRLLGLMFFRTRSTTMNIASHAEGFIALAATFLAYGVTEVAGGYGFLAVFLCARSIRASERSHEYHQVLHNFVEQIERLLTVLLGGAVVRGLLAPLTWEAAAVAVALVLVVRPLVARLSLWGGPGTGGQKTAIAIFGIRGIGSFYYLAYATTHAPFTGVDLLWATTGLVVVVSVLVHGVAASPIMNRLDRARARARSQVSAAESRSG